MQHNQKLTWMLLFSTRYTRGAILLVIELAALSEDEDKDEDELFIVLCRTVGDVLCACFMPLTPGPFQPEEDYLVVADYYKQNVYQLKPDSGEVRAVTLSPCYPISLAFDPSTRGLYMSCLEERQDSGRQWHYRIRKKTFDGKIDQAVYNAQLSTFARRICILTTLSDMELGHWVTGSMGHLGQLLRPGHRVIILTRCETRVFPVFEKMSKMQNVHLKC